TGKKAKRNHEVTTATPWPICLVILTATTYVAINFSINRNQTGDSRRADGLLSSIKNVGGGFYDGNSETVEWSFHANGRIWCVPDTGAGV
ncbi:hypothetical protein, partial [Drancourtella massiliensis]|uniref:hypothetical protein n=1 Tax=Drancourtella massiliensis TaxID=1632013 RepID=UPI00195D148D